MSTSSQWNCGAFGTVAGAREAFCTRKLCCHTLCISVDAQTSKQRPRSVVKHLISISGMLNCALTPYNTKPTHKFIAIFTLSNPPWIWRLCRFYEKEKKNKISDIFSAVVIWHEADLCIKPCRKAISCIGYIRWPNQIENATFVFTLARAVHTHTHANFRRMCKKKKKKKNRRITCDKYFMKMLCRR